MKKINAKIGVITILGNCSYLRNLTERGMVMCKFCENGKIIEFDNGETAWHIQTTEKGYEMIYANHENGRLKSITISNCPICGRKLTDEENEVNDSIKKENIRLKNDLETFTNCLLPRATIRAGEEIKKGNYDLVAIVTNGERCEQKELLDKIEKLNERHQSDCITINQLNVTIDVLVEKLARLREVHGL